MGNPDQFDAFYGRLRRDVLAQALALTGDGRRGRTVAANAFAAAWRRWRTIGDHDPELWVRRQVVRLSRSSVRDDKRGSEPEPAEVEALAHLQGLPPDERELFALVAVGALRPGRAARAMGRPEREVWRRVVTARAALGAAADTDVQAIRELARRSDLPSPPQIRSMGNRTRLRTVMATSAVVTTLVAGAIVVQSLTDDPVALGGPTPGPSSGAPATDPPTAPATEAPPTTPAAGATTATTPAAGATTATPSGSSTGGRASGAVLAAAGMLAPADFGDLAQPDDEPRSWVAYEPFDNTSGSGLNSVCQAARFADPAGLGTLVRKYDDGQGTTAIETIERSASETKARAAFDTAVGWYAGCQISRLQLLYAHRIEGLGDEAILMTLRSERNPGATYSAGFALTGASTLSLVVRAIKGRALTLDGTTALFETAVQQWCGEREMECGETSEVTRIDPPAAGDAPGMLAIVDLPSPGNLAAAWSAAPPTRSRGAFASTLCDSTSLSALGAAGARDRAYLIPDARRLPSSFGINQSVGTFQTTGRAASVIDRVAGQLQRCPRSRGNVKVMRVFAAGSASSSIQTRAWLVRVGSGRSAVALWMGVAREGRAVTQVRFVPAAGAEINAGEFEALVIRARERLSETLV